MARLATSLLFLVARRASATACSDPGSGWTTQVLDSSINFVVHHRVDGSTLHLRLSAQHTGWLGFGLAEPTVGHMKGSDLLTVSVSSAGVVTADDRHAIFAPTTYTPPTYLNGYSGLTAAMDTHNDWTIVEGVEDGGITTVYVTRPLSTSDQQDREVVSGPNRVVWSWGASDTVAYHSSNRGTTSVTFFGLSASDNFPASDGSWTFRMNNFAVPDVRVTNYACQAFTFPTDQDRHIVAFRPIGESIYNHHAILHICQDNSYFANHVSPQLCSYHPVDDPCPGDNCGGGSPLGETDAGCAGLMWSWAVGMGDFVLPAEAGFRVGSGAISHVILEIHYDNPAQASGIVDTMGFEAFYVNTPRPHDAGMLIVGDVIVSLSSSMSPAPPYTIGSLPMSTAAVHRQTTCPSSCTNDLASPITVFAALHHMHLYGHKFITEKYSSAGANLGVVGGRIDHWDNGFQQMQLTNYTINPGDSLQTHCYYDTRAYSYSSAVEFSTATSDEMCQEFLFYYPVQTRNGQPFAFCGLGSFGGVGATVCGALSQASNAFFEATANVNQVDRGTSSFADPLGFGTPNLGAMGATIRFTWSGVHSLYRAASAADFADCVADSSLGFTPAASGGSEDIVLSAAGTYYFLCSVGTHCEAGQKLAVTVEAPGTPPAASSPAAAGGPSGDDDDDDTGAMVGIIIGAVAAVLIVVVGAVLYMRRQPAADAAAGGPTLKKDVQLTNIA